MDPKARRHLELARRNRNIAYALLNCNPPVGGGPGPYGWVAVIAFYSAVHFVNAYLWEQQRWDPRTHDQRAKAVWREPALRPTGASYDRLFDKGLQARYNEVFRVSEPDARQLLDDDLEAVRQAAEKALGNPP